MFSKSRRSPRVTKPKKMVDWRDHDVRGGDGFCLTLTTPTLLLLSSESTQAMHSNFSAHSSHLGGRQAAHTLNHGLSP